MTRQILNLAMCLPKGVTHSFCTPCQEHTFTSEIINEVFTEKLPHYIKELQAEFEKVPMGQVSGLAPKSNGSPFDNCLVEGSWSAEQFALHGGPIPCQGGAPGSRGIPETWPHTWVGRRAT